MSEKNTTTLKKPAWLKSKIPSGEIFFQMKRKMRSMHLSTVCEEAKCPNMAECWEKRTATFMVLGDTCTRGCRFCNVKTGKLDGSVDHEEPEHVALSAKEMGLKYVVLTMVNRDDLDDGGAAHLADVLRSLQQHIPNVKTEILTGDFQGSEESLEALIECKPEVFAHNVETVESLTPKIRNKRFSYELTLDVLKKFKQLAPYPTITKSGLMLGLGETDDEVISTLRNLRDADVDLLTMGQYLQPGKRHVPVERYVTPEEFKKLGKLALEMGFLGVVSQPLVRSSYKAGVLYEAAIRARQ